METKWTTRLCGGQPSRPSPLSSSALAGALLAAVACGGNELEQFDLGKTIDPAANERTPVVKDGSVDPSIAGHWLGEAEDLFSSPGPDGTHPPYTFPSGSRQITLDLVIGYPPLENLISSVMGGDITFGEGPVPEPSAGVSYPPGVHLSRSDVATIPPLEGFTYRVLPGDISSTSTGALNVGYISSQAYTDWCPLQPARADGYGNFDCITPLPPGDPGSGCGSIDEPEDDRGIHHQVKTDFECNLAFLCGFPNQGKGGACTCSQKACTVGYSAPVQLWLMRSGEDLLGNFDRAVFDYGDGMAYLPVGNVRFKRQTP